MSQMNSGTNLVEEFGFKHGFGGAQRVGSMEEASELLGALKGTRGFEYGYVVPGDELKVIIFYEALSEGQKPPRGMVPTLLPMVASESQ